jgi:hypothetical protein
MKVRFYEISLFFFLKRNINFYVADDSKKYKKILNSNNIIIILIKIYYSNLYNYFPNTLTELHPYSIN